jgi:threonylcarbamoyladenosine tRNA methylthiotransferase MtaB
MPHDGLIILAGCGSDTEGMKDGILHISNDRKYLIPGIISGTIDPSFLDNISGDRFGFTSPLDARRNRINLKIQDGCDSFCTYCLIPHLRGKPVSRPLQSILDDFRTLVEAGTREIILTGVQIGQYRDGSRDLADLVEALLPVRKDCRIHIPSISPSYYPEGLTPVLGEDGVVQHMNLSLQSGSDRILDRMNRGYTRDEYLGIVQGIRDVSPDFNLTTDIITGFPGEEKEDFALTLDCIRDANFTHVHTFRFSPRPGTPASLMKNTVPEEVKIQRSRDVIDLYSSQKRTYHAGFHGRDAWLLTEQDRQDGSTGHTEYYLPVQTDVHLERNRFYHVRLSWTGQYLKGTVLSEKKP